LLWHYAFGSGITSEARIGIMSGITVLFLPTPALLEPLSAQQTRVWADFEKGGKRREKKENRLFKESSNIFQYK